VRTLSRALRACLTVVLCSATTATAAQDAVFQTSVAPRPDEDFAAACRYEITLTNPSRRVQGVWVIFERSRDMLLYYQDADVRAFARRHDLALLFPFHCRSTSETGGDMNVDPSKGLGRALFSALSQLAESSGHPELASARLILLGFSGTGSLVGRLAEFAPDRILAVVATDPGHFDPLGVDTIRLSPSAAAIPHLILTGSADAVSGTQRPYAYFRRYFDQGAPWTFVVQNKAPHCCIMNAKALILEWLDAVVVQRATRATGSYGFIETRPTEATDCPDQASPVRPSWCRSTKDAWGGENRSVNTATIERSPNAPQRMMPAGWLPTDTFAKQWLSFVTQPEHPVRLPP
jgi:dienelactone hydrolase